MSDQTEIEEDGATPEPDHPEVPVAPPHTAEEEAEARFFGWKSPDEWAGEKPKGYIDDPRRYTERAYTFKPFKALSEKSEQQAGELRQQGEALRQQAETMRRLDAANDRAMASQRAQHAREIADITTAQRQAAETADVARFDALERRKVQMQAPEPIAREPEPLRAPPEVQDYIAKNDWVKDPALKYEGEMAIAAAQRSGMQFNSAMDQINYAESVMKRKYPQMFTATTAQAKPAAVNRVDGGGLGIGVTRSDAFSKLPSEAQAQFKKFVGEGLFTDNEAGRKQYAEDY